MRPALWHETRLELSRLYQRREVAARHARNLARAKANAYLAGPESGRVWVVDPEPRDLDERAH